VYILILAYQDFVAYFCLVVAESRHSVSDGGLAKTGKEARCVLSGV